MKKTLLLIALLSLVLAVCAKQPKRYGQWKRNKCFIQNCKKQKCFPWPTCNECDRGFLRVQVPLGFACALECPPTQKNVRGTCVEACTSNCKDCKTGSCSVCKSGYALFKAHCIRRCPKGYQTQVNPVGGKKCVRTVKSCTPNCKKCEDGLCSACKRGYALFKGSPRTRARCIRKCPKRYKSVQVNPTGDKKCVKQCKVINCAFCPKWNTLKCFKCKHDLYKLSAGRQDFCFSHCPSGYVPNTLKGVNFCKKAQATTAKTPDQTFQPKSTATQNHTPTPEPETTPTFKPESTTQPEIFTTPESTTEPEPTTFAEEDLWP